MIPFKGQGNMFLVKFRHHHCCVSVVMRSSGYFISPHLVSEQSEFDISVWTNEFLLSTNKHLQYNIVATSPLALRLPDVLERQELSLNLLSKIVMSLILEKHHVVLENSWIVFKLFIFELLITLNIQESRINYVNEQNNVNICFIFSSVVKSLLKGWK